MEPCKHHQHWDSWAEDSECRWESFLNKQDTLKKLEKGKPQRAGLHQTGWHTEACVSQQYASQECCSMEYYFYNVRLKCLYLWWLLWAEDKAFFEALRHAIPISCWLNVRFMMWHFRDNAIAPARFEPKFRQTVWNFKNIGHCHIMIMLNLVKYLCCWSSDILHSGHTLWPRSQSCRLSTMLLLNCKEWFSLENEY